MPELKDGAYYWVKYNDFWFPALRSTYRHQKIGCWYFCAEDNPYDDTEITEIGEEITRNGSLT